MTSERAAVTLLCGHKEFAPYKELIVPDVAFGLSSSRSHTNVEKAKPLLAAEGVGER